MPKKEYSYTDFKIRVKRDKDSKIFTSNVEDDNFILNIYCNTSYTQVQVHEFREDIHSFVTDFIYCPTSANTLPKHGDTGTFLPSEYQIKEIP